VTHGHLGLVENPWYLASDVLSVLLWEDIEDENTRKAWKTAVQNRMGRHLKARLLDMELTMIVSMALNICEFLSLAT